MRCKLFEREVGDWLAGRLPAEVAARMEAHRAQCPACASLARAESELRASLRGWEIRPEPRDLWLAVEARISTPAPARRSWFAPRRMAFAGALAGMLALAGLLLRPAPAPQQQANAVPADEQRVIQLVSDMQRLPDAAGPRTPDIGHSDSGARMALLGGWGEE